MTSVERRQSRKGLYVGDFAIDFRKASQFFLIPKRYETNAEDVEIKALFDAQPFWLSPSKWSRVRFA